MADVPEVLADALIEFALDRDRTPLAQAAAAS
jgi:hypothetical protein